MNGKEKRNLTIHELTLSGYSQEKIAERLGISVSTVYRTLLKLRQSSNQWLVNLAQRDYAHTYREALEGFQHDMMNLCDLLETESVQKNVKLQLQIIREITHVRSEYIKHLLQGPMVWSMQMFVKHNSVQPITEPTMDALGGISGVK